MRIRRNLTKAKPDDIPAISVSWRIAVSVRALGWSLLGPILALLLVGHGFAAEWWEVPPPEQPAQIWSKVRYDPKLTDPFFQSNEWSYWHGGRGLPEEGQDRRRYRHTARCFSNTRGEEHLVRFCKAKSLDGNMIDLLIHEMNPAFIDRLWVQIRSGMFKCQFWTVYVDARKDLIWTTKRQKLTLDKKAYRKGDVIKGRIEFECVQEVGSPKSVDKYGRPSATIKVFGVFKTIVE
jgi:hypothetical protein